MLYNGDDNSSSGHKISLNCLEKATLATCCGSAQRH